MEKTNLKTKIKALVLMLGITFDEVVIEVQIGEYRFDSIEWDRDVDEVYLHTFERTLNIEYDLDSLEDDVKEELHNHLLRMLVI